MPPKKVETKKLDTLEEVIYLLAGLLLLGMILSRFAEILHTPGAVSSLGAMWQALVNFFLWFWSIWKVLAVILAIGSVVSTFYSTLKINEIAKQEAQIFGTIPDEAF